MVGKLAGLLILFFIFPPAIFADWPMAGHDNQRTSRAEDTTPTTYNNGCGQHIFQDYIPSKAHIITVERPTGTSMLYVPTAKGVYALKSTGLTNSASDIVWFYPTSMPVGQSPTVDKASNVMYIPVLDKTIHAVNATTGAKIWQTLKAGGGFMSNPLVANGKVYAGNRDGYVYAFNTNNGSLNWSYKTDGPVDYSPAISADNTILYIGSRDTRAYALNAQTGTLIARSSKFMGMGFYSYWPVVHTAINRVLFADSLNYPENYITPAQLVALYPTDSVTNNVSPFINYLNSHPDQKSLHILDPQTLVERETAPYLWWGNPGGNRYPPALAADGTIWAASPWFDPNSTFGKGRFMGWRLGSLTFTPEPALTTGFESGDEPEAYAIFGGNIWHSRGGDGADGGGYMSLSSTASKAWAHAQIFSMVGEWWSAWTNFKYGNNLTLKQDPPYTCSQTCYQSDCRNICWWGSSFGTHGDQNPPVPLAGKTYVNRSNSVICMQP